MNRQLLLSHPAPRAVVGAPRCQTDPGDMIRQLHAAFSDFKAKQEAKIDAVQTAVDDMAVGAAALRLTGGINSAQSVPTDPSYTELFAGFMRRAEGGPDLQRANAEGARGNIQAAQSVGSPSSGGYLAPVEWDRTISQRQRIFSPMRRIATVVETGVAGFIKVWSDGAWGSGWVGETAARPATTGATLSPLVFKPGEIYAFPQASQQLLDDAAINVEAWLGEEVAETFSLQEGPAFIAGDGVNKPFGLLQYVTGGAADGAHPGGNLTAVASGSAASVTPDGLISFVFSLASAYRSGAIWLMNSLTASKIAQLKDGQGNYIWNRALTSENPDKLLGYTVEIDENMPDLAAGATPIAFGDFKRGYLINDRSGVRVLRDPYSNKPFVGFYTTKRVGGGLLNPYAIRLLKIAAS